jgi:sugar lactone lactonase YvrE
MMRKSHGWAVITMAATVAVAGCGSGSKSGASHRLGDSAITTIDAVARAGAFQDPLDAAPSPKGDIVYFTATGQHGPAIYRVAAAGGAESIVAEGAPLAKPTGVALATTGNRIYVADQQAQPLGAVASAATSGAILTVPAAGAPGTPNVLPGTQGRSPRGLDVVNLSDADVIYFTGTDPASGPPGVFQVPAEGGTVITLAEGAPFANPDSVVVTAQGVAYVTDQGSGPGEGQVFRVNGGTVTEVLSHLHLGSPAGVTLANNDATLLVSSIDPATNSDQVLFLDLATGTTAAATKVVGANKDSSGGLHRARAAPVAAWADTRGTVYRIRFP